MSDSGVAADSGARFFGGGGVGEAGSDRDTDEPFPNVIHVEQIRPLEKLIVAGFVPFSQKEPWEPVRNIVTRLKESDEFGNVDLLPTAKRADRADIFDPWLDFFKASETMQFKGFMLDVPFANSPLGAVERNEDEDQG